MRVGRVWQAKEFGEISLKAELKTRTCRVKQRLVTSPTRNIHGPCCEITLASQGKHDRVACTDDERRLPCLLDNELAIS